MSANALYNIPPISSKVIQIDQALEDQSESELLVLPQIEMTKTRSSTSQQMTSPALPKLEQCKFLCMPIVGVNRENRSLSARRFMHEDDKEKLLADRERAWSTRSSSKPTSASSAAQAGEDKPCKLTRHTERKKRVREINRQKWAKDVIRDEERYGRKASCASLRADKEIQETSIYMDESRDDTCSQVQASLASLNAACQQKLQEYEDQQKKEAEMAQRWEAIHQRRHRIGRERTLAFGNIPSMLNDKRLEDRQWNKNVQVKKPFRNKSVEMTAAVKKPPVKPKASAAVNKPTKQQKEALDTKQVLANRQAMLNSMFGNFSYRCESEYDSEY